MQNDLDNALPETPVAEGETMTLARRASEQAGRLAQLARDNPRAAIAAGAAVAAGVATAAAIPLVRAARRASGNGAKAPATATKAPARKRAPARKPAKKS
jgi:hypothetical protein